jgi:hypothetical protein
VPVMIEVTGTFHFTVLPEPLASIFTV